MKNLKKCVSMLLACLLTGASAAALSGCDVQDILNGLQGMMSSSDVLDANGSGGTSDGSSDSGTIDGEFSVGLSYKLASELGRLDEDEEDYYVVTGTGECTDTCIEIPSTYSGLPVKGVYLVDDYYIELFVGESGSGFSSSSDSDSSSSSDSDSGSRQDSSISSLNVALEDSLKNELAEEGIFITPVAIEKLVIPDSVEFMVVFLGNLKELYIGKGLSQGNNLIALKNNLQTLVIDEENENYSAIDGNIYSKDGKTLAFCFNGQIADGTEKIADSAFTYCSSLKFNEYDNAKYLGNENNPYMVLAVAASKDITSCDIHNDTKIICNYAFQYCSSLTSVTIGNSVTSIGNDEFAYCSSLTSVKIPDSVTSIGAYAFEDCSSLTRVDYNGTIDDWVQISFGSYYANPLYYAEKLYINDELVTEANITTATKISDCAFLNYSNLTSVTIGDSVTSIGVRAFEYCSSLTSVTIGDSVTSIGDSVIYRERDLLKNKENIKKSLQMIV